MCALAGLLFAAGCLVKPQFVIVLAALPFVLLAHIPLRRICLLTALFALGASILLAPWMVRNYGIWHRLVPFSTNGGINLLIAQWPKANGGYMNVDLAACLSTEDLQKHPTLNEVERDVLYRKYAIHFALTSPARTLALAVRKQWLTWYSDADGYSMNIGWRLGWAGFDSKDRVIKRLFQAYYVLIMTLVGYVLFCRRRECDLSGLALAGVLTCAYFVFHGNVRFRFPVMPILDLYAAWGAVLVLARIRRYSFGATDRVRHASAAIDGKCPNI
jgi:hypothetical protein